MSSMNILSSLYLLITFFSSAISLGNEESENKICGTVFTAEGTTVSLREDFTVTPVEFESVHLGKLKNAMFSPVSGCVIKVCGYSWTNKPFYDWKSVYTRNFKDCKIIQYGNETDISNIFNDSFNTSSISCGCAKQVEDCELTCLNKHKKEINWQENDCAVLYEENNCGNCWFNPILISRNEKFRTDRSHYIRSIIIRDNCKVNESHHEEFIRGSVYFPPIKAYLESALKLEYVNYSCACHNWYSTATPSTTSSFTSLPTTSSTTTTTSGTTPSAGTSTKETPEPNGRHTFLSVFQYVMIVGGVVTVAVIFVAAIFIRRRKKHRKLSSNAETTLSYLESEQGDKDMDSGDYFPVLTYPRNGVESEDSQELQLVSADHNQIPVVSGVENQHLSLNNELCTTNAETDVTDKIEDKSNVSQLKAEIMDDVKKLMESFLVGSAYNEEIQFLNATQAASNAGPVDFNLMMEQFNQICDPSNMIPRESFMIPKKQLENPLGLGQFGIVYKAVLRQEPDGYFEQVALKKIKWVGSQSFFREIKILQTIGNANEYVVQFLGACCHTDGLFLLTEFCEGGSLRNYVVERMRPLVFAQRGPLPEMNVSLGDDYYGASNEHEQNWLEENRPTLSQSDMYQLLYWSEQIADGMAFLSANRTIHQDLALRNIVLTKDIKVKICDFGLSRKCLNTEDCARSLMTGDFPFNSFAPEFVNESVNEPRQVSLYVDVWAYGCTLYELFTLGDSLYQDVKEQGLQKCVTVRQMLMEGYRHPKPPLAPDSVYLKMISCWNEVPKNRPSFTELRSFFETEKAYVT